MFFRQCSTSEYAQETDCMKLSALREPQTKDGLASRNGEGRGGSKGVGWALFGEREVVAELGSEALSDGNWLGCKSAAGGGEAEAAGESLNDRVEASWAGTRVGGAGLEAMFEQQPFLDGKQLVHC